MRTEIAIGYVIRKSRKERGWFSSQLSRRVPISRAYLCEIERGDKVPSIAMLSDIAVALEMSPAELLHTIADEMADA